MRAAVALCLYVLWFALAFGVRSWVQWRRTGSTGFRGVSGRPGSVEWLAGVGLVVALVVGVAAPLLDLTGLLDPLGAFGAGWIGVAGAVLAVLGIVATFAAQWSMGDAWLLVPSIVAIAGLTVLVISLEVQVRVVEEPYLVSVHGRRYVDYAARVGRFVPAVGLGPAAGNRPD